MDTRAVEEKARNLCDAIALRADMLVNRQRKPYGYSQQRQEEIDRLQAEYRTARGLADRMEQITAQQDRAHG